MAAVPGAIGKGHSHTKKTAMDRARKENAESILRIPFINFFFFVSGTNCAPIQMNATSKSLGIPIFIAYDSADAWANPELSFS